MIKRFLSLVKLIPLLLLFLFVQCLVLDIKRERRVEKKIYRDGVLQPEVAEKQCTDEAIAMLKEHDSIGYEVYKKNRKRRFSVLDRFFG